MDKKNISSILELILGLFSKSKPVILEKATEIASSQVAKPVEQVKIAPEYPSVIDWSNSKSKISKYFTIEDAIYLREWKRLANAEDGLNDTVKKNLIEIFKKLDTVREHLNKPCFVKSAYRPSAYNIAIGGAARSAHMADAEFGAVDFWCDADGDGDKDGDDCDLIKASLMPHLEKWGLRMEDNGKGARWVHVDNKPVGPAGRFFKP